MSNKNSKKQSKGNPRNQKHCNRNREAVEWLQPREDISKLENISTATSQIEKRKRKTVCKNYEMISIGVLYAYLEYQKEKQASTGQKKYLKY